MSEIESINPIIRKITIGDLKQGLTYKVGQLMNAGNIEITAINMSTEPNNVNKKNLNAE